MAKELRALGFPRFQVKAKGVTVDFTDNKSEALKDFNFGSTVGKELFQHESSGATTLILRGRLC